MSKLIILDFDGTIYNGDSMRDFAKFSNKGAYIFSLLIISFPFIISKIGLIDRDIIKKIFIKINFKGISKNELEKRGKKFFQLHQKFLFPKALKYIKEQQDETVIIVSGSCNEWLAPYGEALNLELFSTELNYDSSGMNLGSISGKNNVGAAKIQKIKEHFNLTAFDEIISFGDSKSDLVLKEISTSYYHKFFN
jgi:HAD superfamily phosphoserine phosphatase-like hydrolase